MSIKSQKGSKTNVESTPLDDVAESVRPEFIYGGPFIKLKITEPFVDTVTPINTQLQGTFKRSFAYDSLKDRMPVIITKVIDYVSREQQNIKKKYSNKKDEDIKKLIQCLNQLKSELMTNKNMALLTATGPNVQNWNNWIEALNDKKYFNAPWLFTECYVYRRIFECTELVGLGMMDPFSPQKEASYADNIEPMCIIAEKMETILTETDDDAKRANLILLLKICLWSNKCDLSLSLGSIHEMSKDPFKALADLKDKLLVDDTGKIADQLFAKAKALAALIESKAGTAYPCDCTKLAKQSGLPTYENELDKAPECQQPAAPEEGAEVQTPCPAKITVPDDVTFDIVCDNSGYELFTDLCVAHFLVAQNIVQKVRFHVKNIPWFISDVTQPDFKFLLESCKNAIFRAEYPAPVTEKPPPAEDGTEPPPPAPIVVSAEALQRLADQWTEYIDNGTFTVMSDNYWTYPHVYKDMKKYDPNMYRKLQFAVMILFKGDLNYRKLLGEVNWNPVLGFEPSLQGFTPAPLAALRTVKSDLISGLPKGKMEQLKKIDPEWMRRGDYGVIQFCGKAEALKASDRPCTYYGDTCKGKICY